MSSFPAIFNCWLIGLAAPGEVCIQAWCCKHPIPRQGHGLPATSKLCQLVQGSLSVSASSYFCLYYFQWKLCFSIFLFPPFFLQVQLDLSTQVMRVSPACPDKINALLLPLHSQLRVEPASSKHPKEPNFRRGAVLAAGGAEAGGSGAAEAEGGQAAA